MKAYLNIYLKDSAIWNKVSEIEIDCKSAYSIVENLCFKRVEDKNGCEVYFRRESCDTAKEIVIEK
nr:MAG TPA: hypothetical protein [Caudoviricetes sp.]